MKRGAKVFFALCLVSLVAVLFISNTNKARADYSTDIGYYANKTICVPVSKANLIQFAKISGSIGEYMADVYTYEKESTTETATYTAYARYNFNGWNYYNGIGYYSSKLQIQIISNNTNIKAVDLTDLDYFVIAFKDTSNWGTEYSVSNPQELIDNGIFFMQNSPSDTDYQTELAKIFNYDIYQEGYNNGLANASYDILKNGHIDYYTLNSNQTSYTLVKQYNLLDYRQLISYDIKQANYDFYSSGGYEDTIRGVYRIYPDSGVMANDFILWINYSVQATFYPVINVSVNNVIYSHDMGNLAENDPLFTDDNNNRFVINLNDKATWPIESINGIVNYIEIDYYLEDYGIETISVGDSASYNEGVLNGYYNGYNKGYNTAEEYYLKKIDDLGIANEGLTNYGNVLKKVFDMSANLLNVQVFPGITIGLILGLPLLLGIFLVIMKFIRG